MNPDGFTLRELVIMAEERGRFEWNQTSSMIAVVINMMRDPKKSKAVTPDMFNPFAKKRNKQSAKKVPITVLRDLFVKGDK